MGLNGAEHFVWSCIQQGDISWFPRMTSSTLQSSEEGAGGEDSLLAARVTRLEASLAELSSKFN